MNDTSGPLHPADSASDPLHPHPTADGSQDASVTAPSVKAAAQEMLKYGLVEQSAKPNIYRTLIQEREALRGIFEPLDLEMQFDETRGMVFLRVAASVATEAEEAWQHPLLRRLRLTTEQSLLVAILRQYFIAFEQESGLGAEGSAVDFDELLAQFDLYLGETGSEQRNQNRLSSVIDQLHKHGIVSPTDKENRIHIRPIIVHLANPDQLQLLLHHFQDLAQTHPAETSPESPSPESDTDD